ncbi:hypothetical protein C8039_05420 [Halogeometricum sp. wsp3]|nr:hypothetical protein C8039_05420 [Halogeometricum sp. wsp3]
MTAGRDECCSSWLCWPWNPRPDWRRSTDTACRRRRRIRLRRVGERDAGRGRLLLAVRRTTSCHCCLTVVGSHRYRPLTSTSRSSRSPVQRPV